MQYCYANVCGNDWNLSFMKKKRNITLKEIAHKLNLSISTVSRALNNHPDINDLTKDKVKKLA